MKIFERADNALVRAMRACAASALMLILTTSLVPAGALTAYAAESSWGGGSAL